MDMKARITSDKWFQDLPIEPRKCRCCWKAWVTREVYCRACKPIYKYRRADYYFLRSNEMQTLDMGVPIWA